jgi:hypothetical protein
VIIALTLAPLVFSLTEIAPAQASVPGAPPCYGASCVGKSPYITNYQGQTCVQWGPSTSQQATDLQTVEGPGDGTSNQVTLRWSSFCHANWAKWSGTDPGYAVYWAETSDGHIQNPEGGGYTYMVNGNLAAMACVNAYGFAISDGEYSCTDWF